MCLRNGEIEEKSDLSRILRALSRSRWTPTSGPSNRRKPAITTSMSFRIVSRMLLLMAAVRGLRLDSVSMRPLRAVRSGVSSQPALFMGTPSHESQQDDAADALMMLAVMDLDGSGGIDKLEFADYLAQYSFTEKASAKIFAALDENGDGEISMTELKKLVSLANENAHAPDLVKQVNAEADAMFDAMDINRDGEISSVELGDYLLDHGYTAIASDAVLRSLDSNEDGALSRTELRAGFLKYSALRQAVVALVKELVVAKRW